MRQIVSEGATVWKISVLRAAEGGGITTDCAGKHGPTAGGFFTGGAAHEDRISAREMTAATRLSLFAIINIIAYLGLFVKFNCPAP